MPLLYHLGNILITIVTIIRLYHLGNILITIVTIIIMHMDEPIDEPIDEVWIIKPLMISNVSPNATDINYNYYEIVLRNQRELIVFDSIQN
jgi:hypothetical protein